MRYTCRELVQSVREQVVEANNTRVSTSQILRAINRGYDDALDMLAKQYPDPLIKFFEAYPDENGQIEIPEDAFQDRVKSVEYYTSGGGDYRARIQETDDLSAHGVYNDVSGGYPALYSIIGRKIQLAPVNVQPVLIRVWYIQTPLPLVLDQGRIQDISPANSQVVADIAARDNIENTFEGLRVHVLDASADILVAGSASYIFTNSDWQIVKDYIVVDSLNKDEADIPINASTAYGKYFNIVDATTGKLKATLQLESEDGQQLVIKTSPTRSTVFNLPVNSLIPDTVTEDDVISSVDGLGVLFFSRPLANYLIQYAVNEVQRMLGVSNLSFEEGKLRELRKKVMESWKKRPGAKFKRAHGKIWSNKPWIDW